MSPKKKPGTRLRILEAAEALIIEHGYAGTSVDRILEEVGITKGAYFYHFKSKAAMAQALVEHIADKDLGGMEENSARARGLSPDPLESLLVFCGLYIEQFENRSDNPGCLFVAYSSETGQFGREVAQVLDHVVKTWRAHLVAWLDEAAAAHPPVREFDRESLADMFTVVFEGCYVVGRMSRDTTVFVQQLRHYRDYVEMLFKGA